MKKPYENVQLPSWIKSASKDRLIEHIKYLSHNYQTISKQLQGARYRYRKAEKELKEVKINGNNEY